MLVPILALDESSEHLAIDDPATLSPTLLLHLRSIVENARSLVRKIGVAVTWGGVELPLRLRTVGFLLGINCGLNLLSIRVIKICISVLHILLKVATTHSWKPWFFGARAVINLILVRMLSDDLNRPVQHVAAGLFRKKVVQKSWVATHFWTDAWRLIARWRWSGHRCMPTYYLSLLADLTWSHFAVYIKSIYFINTKNK